ncbi:MAG: hypothetical protein ACK5LX_13305 [Oscillospiraceae bacterium]
MNKQLRHSLCVVAESVSMTEQNKQDWIQNAVKQRKPVVVPGKFKVILVAAITVMVLCGAGFVGKYLYNRYVYVMPKEHPHYNLFVDEEEEGPPLAVDSIDTDTIRDLMKDKKPGEVLHTTLMVDGTEVEFHAVRGDNLDSARYRAVGDTSYKMLSATHSGQLPEKNMQEDFERLKESGMLYATLEGEEYTLIEVNVSSLGRINMRYTGPDGVKYSVTTIGMGSQLIIPEGTGGSAEMESVTVGDRLFNYLEYEQNGNKQSSMYLPIGEQNTITDIEISGFPTATREQLVKTAESLVLHNGENNPIVSYDEAFFQALPDPVLRENAAAIAKAMLDAKNPDAALEDIEKTDVVWEKDGRSIEIGISDFVGNHPNRFILRYKGMDYNTVKKLGPVADTQGFFEEMDWFDGSKMDIASYYFTNGVLTSAGWGIQEEEYHFGYTHSALTLWSSGAKTALDYLPTTMLAMMKPMQVVKDKEGVLFMLSEAKVWEEREVYFVTVIIEKAAGGYSEVTMRVKKDSEEGRALIKWAEENPY